jgi:hypothetical protein
VIELALRKLELEIYARGELYLGQFSTFGIALTGS